jgi:hypothetical protein
VILVDVHELEIVFAQPITIGVLEYQVEHIRRVFSLEGQNILILSSTKDLGKGGEVDTQSYVTVAAVWGEAFGLEHHRDEGHMRVVHGLESDTGVIAVEVAVLDQILDCIDDLLVSALLPTA